MSAPSSGAPGPARSSGTATGSGLTLKGEPVLVMGLGNFGGGGGAVRYLCEHGVMWSEWWGRSFWQDH